MKIIFKIHRKKLIALFIILLILVGLVPNNKVIKIKADSNIADVKKDVAKITDYYFETKEEVFSKNFNSRSINNDDVQLLNGEIRMLQELMWKEMENAVPVII